MCTAMCRGEWAGINGSRLAEFLGQSLRKRLINGSDQRTNGSTLVQPWVTTINYECLITVTNMPPVPAPPTGESHRLLVVDVDVEHVLHVVPALHVLLVLVLLLVLPERGPACICNKGPLASPNTSA
jgi:hypothetical protein